MNDDPDSTSIQLEIAVLDPLWREILPDLPIADAPDEPAQAERCLVGAAAAAAYREGVPETLRGTRCEISLVLSDDARVRVLNRDYRGIDKATNVLSFAAFDDLSGPPEVPRAAEGTGNAVPNDVVLGDVVLGDVVLARETVVREALEQGKTITDHLSHLVVHGVLHLLGFDHETDADAQVMEGREVAVLARLGIADPYLADEAEPAADVPQGRCSPGIVRLR